MTTTTPNRLISRVNRLINHATSETDLEERLARADQIMATHMLEEAQLRVMQKPEERRKPVTVDVTELFGSDARMQRLGDRVARTVGVRLVVTHEGRHRKLTLVGFQEDVGWAQRLFSCIQEVFSSYLEPQWDEGREFVMNLVVLRESGMSWSQVLDHAVAAGAVEDTWSDVPDTTDRKTGRTWNSTKARWSAEDKLNLAYRNWCRDNDREPVNIRRHEAYRQAYPEVVARRVRAFLDQMKATRHADDTSAAEMLLRSVENDVENAVQEHLRRSSGAPSGASRQQHRRQHHSVH